MRLKYIKLAGFKSFVDPTTIPVTGSNIGIVGPNGCGKSNIIDAIRWVMGEMSARTLRGDSMADVIFNGSNTRKPVAQASVELVFDNSDGRAGGPYARFGEISIRREAGRDGQSDYFLNKTRCRRKDITDLFLGTGLGPRAYSIIEQGMISRVVEAKPEELRGFIEEAAGISRYKERRRETETRIRHTRENLARVEDVRRELESQLDKLKRQSRAAERYKELKQEERRLRAQLLAMRWRTVSEKLAEHDARLSGLVTSHEAALARVRAIEAEMERTRAAGAEAAGRYQAVQAEFYAAANEITRLEQAIAHARETRENLAREQERLEHAWQETDSHLGADRRQREELENRLAALAPRLAERTQARDAAVARREQAERALAAWQAEWEAFNAVHAEQAKQRELEAARIQGLQQRLAQLDGRFVRLGEEAAAIEAQLGEIGTEVLRREAAGLDELCDALEKELAALESQIQQWRRRREELAAALDEQRGRRQSCEARLASLEAQQRCVPDSGALAAWLRAQGLETAPRLAGKIAVEHGWERAVERVLGEALAALCVSGMPSPPAPEEIPALRLLDLSVPATASETRDGRLLGKVATDVDLAPLLAGIHVAETLEEALARREALAAHESIVTRRGEWIGRNWLVLGSEGGERTGFLARQREIETLARESAEAQQALASLEAQHAEAAGQLLELEQRRDELVRRVSEQHRRRAALHERLGHDEARWKQLGARLEQIRREREEIEAQRALDVGELEQAHARQRAAEDGHQAHEARRQALAREREVRQTELDVARAQENEARDALHRLEIERESLQASFDAANAGIERLTAQQRILDARRAELVARAASVQSEEELKAHLDALLEQRLGIEARLNAARAATQEIDERLRELEQARSGEEKEAQAIRAQIESERVAREALAVRRDTLTEQLRETGAAPEAVAEEVPAEATEEAWTEQLERVAQRIERLGPINLAAIHEYEQTAERKGYLDKQYDDLVQALATLEEAIRKMDRETRTRFKETFDRLNERFQTFFPRLFGGGSAYLELTDNDLLETGVTVMARPPGKRNSTIHLLSGGEKALTAVALLFALFELNPAPFCLLDEVDAPLDDVNVVRYCETLKAMSERTQLIFITHNKITMEMADVLIGVTMSEPGVSRLVAVDVDEAMQMVAQ